MACNIPFFIIVKHHFILNILAKHHSIKVGLRHSFCVKARRNHCLKFSRDNKFAVLIGKFWRCLTAALRVFDFYFFFTTQNFNKFINKVIFQAHCWPCKPKISCQNADIVHAQRIKFKSFLFFIHRKNLLIKLYNIL